MRLFNNMPIFGRMTQSRVPQWCIPLVYALVSIVASFALPRIEAYWLPEWKSGISVGSAMAIYSSIASGMIALTGIVFSLMFVMVQFSATAYTPRLVIWLYRDPVLYHGIGVFTATFLYAIAALAWVDRRGDGQVPFFSGWLVVGLLAASVGVFVAMVQRISRLQINSTLAFTAHFARKLIEVMYPPMEAVEADQESLGDFRHWPVTQALTYSGPPRAVQAMDVPRLLALAERSDSVIEMVCAVGDTWVESTTLMHVYREHGSPQKPVDEHALRKAVKTGAERTFEQDPKYSIRLLVDIAIRALSPAVNDPTTAVQTLDQLEDLLLRLGRRRLGIGVIRDHNGRVRVTIPVPEWEDLLDLALTEIRACGATSTQVMRRMKAMLTDLIDALPDGRDPALRIQQRRLDHTIAGAFPDLDDRLLASVEDREGLGAPRKNRVRQKEAAT